MPATRRTRKTTERFDALAQNQSDLDRKQKQSKKAMAEKEARKRRNDENHYLKKLENILWANINDTATSTKPSLTFNPPFQASAPPQTRPIPPQTRPIPPQTRPIPSQNWTAPTISAPKIAGYLNKEGPGISSLEIEYPPNFVPSSGLVAPEFEFYFKNGDIVIHKKHSIEFFIAKKKEKKGTKFTLKKIYYNTSNETTKGNFMKILFTISPGVTAVLVKTIHDAAFDALRKRGII